MALSEVKALAFDVFGTVVDYRGTIIREGERLNRTKGLQWPGQRLPMRGVLGTGHRWIASYKACNPGPP